MSDFKEELQTQESAKNSLVEKWDKILVAEDEGLKPIVAREDKKIISTMLENQQIWLKENQSSAGDIGQFHNILVPTVRRIAPALVANQIAGVQPMSGPNGYAYALRSSYAGTNTNSLSAGVNPLHRGDIASSKTGPQFQSVIITVPSASAVVLGENVWKTSGGTDIQGVVKYFEVSDGVKKVLVEYDYTTGAPTNAFVAGANTYFNGANTTAIVVGSIINNESLYNLVLRSYAGPVDTATGEALADDMKSMRLAIERSSIEAQTRKLKAEYTLEMVQDLKHVHNLDAEAELMKILQYEIAAEIDRDLVAAINDNATVGAEWIYGNIGSAANTTGHADGQWEQEKVRTLYSRILRESNRIAITTRRGPGNFIIASPSVVAALQGLNNFMHSQVANDLGPVGGITRVGTLDNTFTVYSDTFHFDASGKDYVTVGYKGPGNMDSGVIYCPYIPLQMQKITHEKTFQPAIGVLTRSAISYNLQGTDNYYVKFAVDFSGSQFA